MKKKINLLWIAIMLLTTIMHTTYAQNTGQNVLDPTLPKTSRYGGGIGLLGNVPFGDGNVGLVLGGEYSFSIAKATSTQHYFELLGGLSLMVGEGTYLYGGGGYKFNLTAERGQPTVLAGVESPYVGARVKMLFSRYNQYANGFGASLVVYPTGGSFGIGGFFDQEYDCNVFGGKIVLRFGGDSYTSSSRSRSSPRSTPRLCPRCPY